MRVLKRVSTLAAILPLLACHPPRAAVDGQKLLRQGDLDAARRTIDDGTREHPDNAELRRLSIDVRLALDQRKAAVQAYRGWLDRKGKDNDMLRHMALGVLRWGLRHRDPAVRLAALQGARRTDEDTLEQDVAERLEDPSELVRSWAAVAMSRTPAGADALERQLRSPDPRARAVAVGNLARIAGRTALGTLTRSASDRHAAVRAALARGLGSMGGSAPVPLLCRLARDGDRSVRRDAVQSLGQTGRRRALEAVRAALDDPYLGVRLAAVLALAELQGVAAKPELRRLAEGDDPSAALRAGVRLARLGEDQPVLNAIAKGLVDAGWTVRAAACNAATSLRGDHRVARKLVADKGLRDPEPRVRIAAARAVLALGDRAAAARTATLLHGLACGGEPGMEGLCVQAAEILMRTDDRRGARVLERIVRSGREAANRRESLRIALTGGALLELAADALADPDPSVAILAATQIYLRTD